MASGRQPRFDLGWGEFVTPEHHLQGARVAFMEAILTHAPAVFNDLVSCGTTKLFREMTKEERDSVQTHLDEWAREYHLDGEPWILDIARETLDVRAQWQTPPARSWFYPGWSETHPLWPECPAWNPSIETERAFHERVEKHKAEVKKLARQAALVRPFNKSQPKHFQWLVDYQLLEFSRAEIVCREQLNGSAWKSRAVQKAIASTAKLIGLTLRT